VLQYTPFAACPVGHVHWSVLSEWRRCERSAARSTVSTLIYSQVSASLLKTLESDACECQMFLLQAVANAAEVGWLSRTP
jgi:hypothetical protein